MAGAGATADIGLGKEQVQPLQRKSRNASFGFYACAIWNYDATRRSESPQRVVNTKLESATLRAQPMGSSGVESSSTSCHSILEFAFSSRRLLQF